MSRRTKGPRRGAATGLLVSACCAVAHGQTQLTVLTGPPGFGRYGYALAAAGDVNGDGVPDALISILSREVRVLSGFDWSVLATFDVPDPAFPSLFGVRAAGLGDVDADGRDDFAVSQPSTQWYAGAVWVVSGATGAVLHAFRGAPGDFLGHQLAAVGDVDGDGVGDLAAAALNWVVPGHELEYVLVWSGRSGETLHRFDAPALGDLYGETVAAAGDIDGDGRADIAISLHDGASTLEVRSGADGARLFAHLDPGTSGGRPTTTLGDVDGDGRDDFVVARHDHTGVATALWAYSGTGALLWSRAGNGAAGAALASVGDLDGDGNRDLLAGDPNAGPSSEGLVRVYSGRTGATLNEYPGPPGAYLTGGRVAELGDVDGDGTPELLVSDDAGLGAVRVLRGGALRPLERFCAAVANSTGLPAALGSTGYLSAADRQLRLQAERLPAHALGVFVRGAEPAAFPFGDGTLCVSPFAGGLHRIEVVQADGAGTTQTDRAFDVPGAAAAIVAGSSWCFQLVFRDPAGGPAGFNTSDALRGTFAP